MNEICRQSRNFIVISDCIRKVFNKSALVVYNRVHRSYSGLIPAETFVDTFIAIQTNVSQLVEVVESIAVHEFYRIFI